LLIVLEGTDGGGKSAAASALQDEWLAAGHLPDSIITQHFGPPEDPHQNPLEEYVLPLDQPPLSEMIASHRALVIFDRLSVGDVIYGERYRGYMRFTPESLLHCEMTLSALGALKVVLSPPLEVAQQRVAERGDDYIENDDLPRIHDAYLTHAAEYGWLVPDWQLSPDILAKALLNRAWGLTVLASHLSQPSQGTYTGDLTPDLILVGDEVGIIKTLGPFTLTRPFTPVTGHGCSEWLLSATREAGIMNKVGLVNAYHPGIDLTELARVRPSAKWVALGVRASRALAAHDIKHVQLHHPQYEMRFNHKRRSEYAAQLRVAVGMETGNDELQCDNGCCVARQPLAPRCCVCVMRRAVRGPAPRRRVPAVPESGTAARVLQPAARAAPARLMEITAETASRAYITLLQRLAREGEPVTARGRETVELRRVTLIIGDPAEVHVLRTARRPAPAIAATEAIHLIAGTSSLVQLDMASGGRFSQFADGGRLRGAYGPRAYSRLEEIAELLSADSGTRQAVASVWRGDERAELHDVPCTTSYMFALRGGLLELTTFMRSNDAWLGLPYDLEVAGALQRTMAGALGVPAGSYGHVVKSMHLYSDDAVRAEAVAQAGMSVPSRTAVPAVTTGSEPGALARRRWQRLRYAASQVVLRGPRDVMACNQWYTIHVPALPLAHDEWDICSSCRYVTDGLCTECELCSVT
jgi:thymidylate synthase